jgi:hypothetical protein
MITSLLWLRRRRYTHRVSFGCNPRVLTWKITVKDITTNNAQQGAHIMKPLSETYKVSYIDWQDDEGNCGTSYAIILEAESKEEAEVELSTFATNKG